MSADRVTSQIGPWGQVPRWILAALSGDCTAIAVYTALSTWAERGDDCFPHQATIADLLGITPDTVSRVIGRLAEQGLVTVTPRLIKGRKIGNEYELAQVDPGTARGAGSVPPEPRGGADRGTARGRGSLDQTKDQTRTTRADDPALLNAEFDVWWKEYPRRVDKARAREKYLARRRAGATAADLLAAARQYGRERDGESAEFTKHPATFLNRNDGPWAEALARSRRTGSREEGPRDVDAIAQAAAERRARWDAMTDDEREAERRKDPAYLRLLEGEG